MSGAAVDRRGQVALIVGAGSGVGRATAELLASDGLRQVLVSRDAAALAETARLIERAGGANVVVPADITDEAAVRALTERVVADMGGVDVLVYAAGVGLYGPVEHYSLADWQTTLATNLTGAFLCCRAVVGPMRARGGGAIVAIGSGAGKQGYANLAAYAASKFGLIGFMQSLAAEVADDGIKVSTILPGSILTGFAGRSAAEKRAAAEADPTKRYLEPVDVAEAVQFLLRQPDRAWTQELNLWPF